MLLDEAIFRLECGLAGLATLGLVALYLRVARTRRGPARDPGSKTVKIARPPWRARPDDEPEDVEDSWLEDDDERYPLVTWYLVRCRRCQSTRPGWLPADRTPAPKICAVCGEGLYEFFAVVTDHDRRKSRKKRTT